MALLVFAMNKRQICKWYSVCPMKYYYEMGKLSKKWVEGYCFCSNPDCVRKRLEEEGAYHPDNMLPNGSIDKNLTEG